MRASNSLRGFVREGLEMSISSPTELKFVFIHQCYVIGSNCRLLFNNIKFVLCITLIQCNVQGT